MRRLKQFLLVLGIALVSPAHAALIVSGQTNVLLDTALLATVGLNLTGVAGPVIVPGDLGPGSVAFPINPRNAVAPALPTTFAYTPGTIAPFSGTIEHSGSVIFNGNTPVGNFTIGFDAGRVGGSRSGFFVADNVTFVGVPLFDLGGLVPEVATNLLFQAFAQLLVSSELAGALGSTALTGADVGDARVVANAVAEPATLALLGFALVGFGFSRRRKLH